MESIVVILDVSTGMQPGGSTENLEKAIQTVSLLVQEKILFKPKDEIGLVLMGTKETRNALEEDGYQNIYVERDVCLPDVELLRQIHEIQPGEAQGDFIDALIVGLDMLVTKTQNTKKKLKPRIFFLTNASTAVDTDSLESVTDHMKKIGAQLDVFGIDFDKTSEDEDIEDLLAMKDEPKDEDEEMSDDAVKARNELLLLRIAHQVNGAVISLPRAFEIMSQLRAPSVKQTPVFTGFFELTEDFSIKVKVFIKTKHVGFPTMKKISKEAKKLDDADTTDVKMDRTYHSINDLDKNISKVETVKGYKYGKSLVPISAADETALKYSCSPCLQLIGFTKKSNVSRHHYMGNTELVSPYPGNQEATTAMSSLVRAMEETESVAIARYSPRKDGVKMVVLVPHVSADQEDLFLHKLPFAEDLRHFPFPPLDPKRARPSIVPSADQLEAVDQLIDDLDLLEAGEDEDGDPVELLKPKHTYNPVLQHFYQTVKQRALQPEMPVPKMKPEVEEIITPNKAMFDAATKTFARIEELFPLEIVKPQEKVKTRYWADSTVDELRLENYAVDEESKKKKGDGSDPMLSIDAIIAGGVSDVGSIEPVKDFKQMIARRDVDLVDKAIEQMKERIQRLLNDSVKDQLYPKALDCMKALREGCVEEEEPAAFNTFIQLLRSIHEGKRHDGFWQLLVSSSISLIHEEECQESDVTKEESRSFLDTTPATEPESTTSVSTSNDVDDLFDLIE